MKNILSQEKRATSIRVARSCEGTTFKGVNLLRASSRRSSVGQRSAKTEGKKLRNWAEKGTRDGRTTGDDRQIKNGDAHDARRQAPGSTRILDYDVRSCRDVVAWKLEVVTLSREKREFLLNNVFILSERIFWAGMHYPPNCRQRFSRLITLDRTPVEGRQPLTSTVLGTYLADHYAQPTANSQQPHATSQYFSK